MAMLNFFRASRLAGPAVKHDRYMGYGDDAITFVSDHASKVGDLTTEVVECIKYLLHCPHNILTDGDGSEVFVAPNDPKKEAKISV